jgi:polyisoprenoid-binding protein YceI
MGLETIAKWSVMVPRSKCRTQWPSGAAAASQPTADPRPSLVKTMDFTVKKHGFHHAKGGFSLKKLRFHSEQWYTMMILQ